MPAKKSGAAPGRLTSEQKQYIVLRLAMYGQPAEIIEELAKFEPPLKDVSHQTISKYNPTLAMGAKLSDELKKLFWETRERWGNEIQAVPIAHLRRRLEIIDRYLAEGAKSLPPGVSPKMAFDGLELVEKMIHGAFKPAQTQLYGFRLTDALSDLVAKVDAGAEGSGSKDSGDLASQTTGRT